MGKLRKPERRFITDAKPWTLKEEFDPLSLLLGTWRTPQWPGLCEKKPHPNTGSHATGWNMIALPFDEAPFNYRVLMNQYCEELHFGFVDDDVPNRGLAGIIDASTEKDQLVFTIDYLQKIHQVIADDSPSSATLDPPGLAGSFGHPIHHEPGLWLCMRNLRAADKDITGNAEISVARLASIPHGNSVLALGTSSRKKGPPDIGHVSGLPIGRFEDLATAGYDVLTRTGDGTPGDPLEDPYLEPYNHYCNHPFKGTREGHDEFPGFNPKDMNEILRWENRDVEIEQTTILAVDSTRQNAGIANIPFVVKQAEPVSMKSTFWIQELKEKDKNGCPKLRLQYSQVVIMNFFRPREDGLPGRAQWPHVSINTLEKISDS